MCFFSLYFKTSNKNVGVVCVVLFQFQVSQGTLVFETNFLNDEAFLSLYTILA